MSDESVNDPAEASGEAKAKVAALVEQTVGEAASCMEIREVAMNGPVYRDLKRLCELLNLTLAAVNSGKNPMGKSVSLRESGEDLRESVQSLIAHGSWMRLDLASSDVVKQQIHTIHDLALEVIAALVNAPDTPTIEAESPTSEPSGTAPTVRSQTIPVRVAMPAAQPILDARPSATPATVKSLRPLARPPTSTGEQTIGGETLNLRRLSDAARQASGAGPLVVKKPELQLPPVSPVPAAQPRQSPAWVWPVLIMGGLVAGLALLGVLVYVIHGYLPEPKELVPVVESSPSMLPPGYATAKSLPKKRAILLQHLVETLDQPDGSSDLHGRTMTILAAYEQHDIGPTQPIHRAILEEEIGNIANELTDKAMANYPPFDARPAVAEARRRYPVHELGDQVAVNYRVNPTRVIQVKGEYRGLSRGVVTIGNRQVPLEDIIEMEPGERDRFDKSRVLRARQAYVAQRQEAYDTKRLEIRDKHFDTYRKQEAKRIYATNEELGHVLKGASWMSPGEYVDKLLTARDTTGQATAE